MSSVIDLSRWLRNIPLKELYYTLINWKKYLSPSSLLCPGFVGVVKLEDNVRLIHLYSLQAGQIPSPYQQCCCMNYITFPPFVTIPMALWLRASINDIYYLLSHTNIYQLFYFGFPISILFFSQILSFILSCFPNLSWL